MVNDPVAAWVIAMALSAFILAPASIFEWLASRRYQPERQARLWLITSDREFRHLLSEDSPVVVEPALTRKVG